MKRILIRAAAVLAILYLIFLGAVAWAMAQPPDTFGRFMAKMPMATFLVVPFETLWTRIRGGQLKQGDPAPDFSLKRLDEEQKVSLSSLRGQPVVLVFGSYT
jgi:cytochrome oxidase Cu insertion factor (SCO1/SenC/PrrC family)